MGISYTEALLSYVLLLKYSRHLIIKHARWYWAHRKHFSHYLSTLSCFPLFSRQVWGLRRTKYLAHKCAGWSVIRRHPYKCQVTAAACLWFGTQEAESGDLRESWLARGAELNSEFSKRRYFCKVEGIWERSPTTASGPDTRVHICALTHEPVNRPTQAHGDWFPKFAIVEENNNLVFQENCLWKVKYSSLCLQMSVIPACHRLRREAFWV